MGIGVAEGSKATIKTEPVYAVDKMNNRECFRCGAGNFTTDHIKKCPATSHKCEFCNIMGHLEKCCNQKYPERRRQMKQRMQNRRIGFFRVNYISEDSEEELDEDEMVLQVDGTGVKPFEIEGLMCGNKLRAIIDTGPPVSIFAIDELRRIIGRRWVVVRDMIDGERYVDFNRRPLPLLAYMFVSIQVGKTKMSKARVLVAKKGAKSIVGRDWLTAMKYRIEPPITKGENVVNSISNESDESENKLSRDAQHIVQEFPNLFKRRGRVNNYKIKIEMKDDTRITEQKGRRIPMQLQDLVDNEINNLLEQGHIERVDTMYEDDVFIQPVVITVKKDRSVKTALDARALNDSIAKDKYQMPNLENLMDMVAETIDGKEGQVFYSSIDMKYAYGQIPLEESTAKHCNFQIIGGKSTGTYRFVTGHYGLTKMPTEFQKVMDLTLVNMDSTFVYIDDILIVTKGEKSVHMQKVREVLEVLDKANLQLKADKCKIACTEIEWLEYKLSGEGVAPINGKIQGISERLRPNNLKELGSFLGAVNQLNNFIPDLASICAPFTERQIDLKERSRMEMYKRA